MIGFLLPFLAAATVSADDGRYMPSPEQLQVDRSFSDIPIDAPLDQLEDRLTKIVESECEQWGECARRDAEGVRYHFWADEPFTYFIVVKSIHADEFEGRAIPALGIGLARGRGQVMAAARRFVPEADFECAHFEEESTEVCSATLHPGWVTIRFDASGSLTQVQLDGYHFT